jgi:CCR4-NOT transcription complex subunit 7/8
VGLQCRARDGAPARHHRALSLRRHGAWRRTRPSPGCALTSSQDTEFPGIVARPIGTFKGSSDYHYQTLRCNVDLLKLIQLGITLCDEQGNLPPDVCTWQFNFRFSVKCVGGEQRAAECFMLTFVCSDDMCAPESLDLLHKAGLDFERHDKMGIDVEHFGELLITSGLALFDDVRWVSFHS